MNRMCLAARIRSKKVSLAGLLIAFLALGTFPAWGQTARYKVRLDFTRPLHATVDAQLLVTDGAIFTARHAGGYAWWDFIKNVREVQGNRNLVPLEAAGEGRWSLRPGAGPVRLNYQVDLSFTEPTRIGDLRGGRFFGDSLYLVNRALFLLSNATGPKDVEFDMPPGFAIATPWPKTADHFFRAADNRELTDNWTVLGRFPAVEFK